MSGAEVTVVGVAIEATPLWRIDTRPAFNDSATPAAPQNTHTYAERR
jgi:hypothetical protein